ncbi:MAG: 2'-5' RNA ligase family protein [Marmoricola sp.]
MDSAEFTGLVVPVHEADRLVRARAPQTGAHVTLLAPFADPDVIDEGVVDELERFFGDVTPFPFTLAEVCQFPGGTAYLAPEPAAVFRRLTAGLHRLFPELPPYGGRFDDVVPHLTVPGAEEVPLERLRAELAGEIPLQARATRAELVVGTTTTVRETLATFRFGVAAA